MEDEVKYRNDELKKLINDCYNNKNISKIRKQVETNKTMKEIMISWTYKWNEPLEYVLSELVRYEKNDLNLRNAIIKIGKTGTQYGLHGLAILVENGDKEAKKILFDIAEEGKNSFIVDEMIYLAYKGNRDAKSMLYEFSKNGSHDAICSLVVFVNRNDEEVLDFLLKLSTDRNELKTKPNREWAVEYRISFAIRALVKILKDAKINDLDQKFVDKTINIFLKIGKSGEYDILTDLKRELGNIGYEAYNIAIDYPKLEPLITFLIGKEEKPYKSSIGPFTVVYKTVYGSSSEDTSRRLIR